MCMKNYNLVLLCTCGIIFLMCRRSVSVSHRSERSTQFTGKYTECHEQFSLRCVNGFGEYLDRGESALLRDKGYGSKHAKPTALTLCFMFQGGDPVVFQHRVCLAMEWQNNPKKPHYVSVEEQGCLVSFMLLRVSDANKYLS